MAALLLASAAPTAAAQTTSSVPSPFPTGSTVSSMVVDGDFVYMTGVGRLGPPSSPFSVISAADGSFIRGYPGMVDWAIPPNTDGSITPTEAESVESDGAGGWFVSGGFQRVEGTSLEHFVHVRADGSIDPAFRPESNGIAYRMLLRDGVLWVAGTFNRIGGREITGLAALDPRTGAVLDRFPHGMDGAVWDMALDPVSGRLYVVGGFSRAGGDAHPRMAAIDPASGAVLDWTPALPGGEPSRVSAYGDTVYVSGDMHDLRYEDMRIGAVALNAADGAQLPLDFGIYEGGEIVATSRAVAIGGEFKDGSRVQAFAPRTATRLGWFAGEREPTAFEVWGDRLLVAGFGGGMVGIDLRTGAPDGFVGGAGGAANDIALGGGRIAVAGRNVGNGPSVLRNGIAAIDLRTNTPTDLALEAGGKLPGFPTRYGGAAVVAKQGDWLFVGGDFTEISGRAEKGIAAYNVRTGAWRDLADVEGRVSALAFSGDRLFVGGTITKVGEVAVRNLGAIDLSTGAAVPWSPVLNDWVLTLAVSGGTLHVGGRFSPYLVAYDAATLERSAVFTTSAGSWVESIVPDGSGGRLVRGAVRRRRGSPARRRVGRYRGATRRQRRQCDRGRGGPAVRGRLVQRDQRRPPRRVRRDPPVGPDRHVVPAAPGPVGDRAGDRPRRRARVRDVPDDRAHERERAGAVRAGVVGRGAGRRLTAADLRQPLPGRRATVLGARVERVADVRADPLAALRRRRRAAASRSTTTATPQSVRAADAGHRFRVEAVAWNDGGASAPVRSAPGPLMVGHGPETAVGPQVWGRPVVGAVLTADGGLYEPDAASVDVASSAATRRAAPA